MSSNGKQVTTLEERGSVAVLNVTQPPVNLTQMWSLRSSATIGALIDFRSALHRWQAAGRIDSAEFIGEAQRLTDAGLATWFDELIALATNQVGGAA